MVKGQYDGYDTVSIFGTLIEEKRRSWVFAPEDEGEILLGKRVADWEDDGEEDDDPREGVMHMPRWLARKHKLIRELPHDDHHAWHIILKPTKTFRADTITVVKK